MGVLEQLLKQVEQTNKSVAIIVNELQLARQEISDALDEWEKRDEERSKEQC